MNEKRVKVLLVGLDPAVVDYGRWPQLTPESLMASLRAEQESLNALGYDASLCLTDKGETAERVVAERLSRDSFHCVLIGAGVRTDPSHLILFETLINLIHRAAPQAKICFNTNPSDTAAAVRRWV